jgi:hypothetical protein
VLNKEETRVIYSHGLKGSGGEVFIEPRERACEELPIT